MRLPLEQPRIHCADSEQAAPSAIQGSASPCQECCCIRQTFHSIDEVPVVSVAEINVCFGSVPVPVPGRQRTRWKSAPWSVG